MTPNDTFALAWRSHQAGDMARAEQLYRQVIDLEPNHADAWCFLGAACQAQGRKKEAEANLRQAVFLLPRHTTALNCLGILLAEQGQFSDAESFFKQASSADPLDAESLNNLGQVYARQGRTDDAIQYYQKSLTINPQFMPARSNLELALRQRGSFAVVRNNASSANFGSSTPDSEQRTPDPKAAYSENLHGVKLAQEGKYNEAFQHFQRALDVDPGNLDAHNNLGNILNRLKRHEEGIAHYQEVLRRVPNHITANYNLGVVRADQGRDEEAMIQYRRTIQLEPTHADAHYNLGIVLARHGHVDEAIAVYDAALKLRPSDFQSRWNRAMLVLSKGDFENGWPEYEWRWKQAGVAPHGFKQPQWDGSPLNGRTIVLHAEQGLGDTLQFIRYVPLVKARGGKIILLCQPPLAGLLARLPGIEKLVTKDQALPDCDVHAPLLTLPGIFKTSVRSIPATIPYLTADQVLVANWRKELEPMRGLKIGIAWQGSPTFREDRFRSIPLGQFAKLAEIEGVHLISLQKGPGTEQLASLPKPCKVLDLGSRLDEANGPFMDTAALMMNLDLVITSDTAVPHLAGALGEPVWLAVHLVPDWRWLLHRQDSPWYPSMRVFRQTKSGQWDDVFERISAALKVYRK